MTQQHVLWTRVAVLVEALQRTKKHELWRLVSAVPALGRFMMASTHLIEEAMDRFTRPVECKGDLFNDEKTRREWRLPNGWIHRGGDLPAVVSINTPESKQEWWYRGRLHRENGPAVIYGKEQKYWYKNGRLVKFGCGRPRCTITHTGFY